MLLQFYFSVRKISENWEESGSVIHCYWDILRTQIFSWIISLTHIMAANILCSFFWFLVKAVDLMDLDFAAAFFQFFCCLPFLSLSFKHKTPVSITRNTFNRGFLYWFSTQFFCITIFHPSRLLRVRPIGHSSKLQFPHYLRSHVKRPVLSHLASSERRTQWWWPWASTGKLVRWKFEHFTLWCDAIQHSRL